MGGQQNQPRASSEASPRGSDPNLQSGRGWVRAHLGGRMIKFTSWSIGRDGDDESPCGEGEGDWGLGARSRAGSCSHPLSLTSLAGLPSSLSALIPPTFSSPLRLFLIHRGNSLGALRSCLHLFLPRQTTTRPRNGWRFSSLNPLFFYFVSGVLRRQLY